MEFLWIVGNFALPRPLQRPFFFILKNRINGKAKHWQNYSSDHISCGTAQRVCKKLSAGHLFLSGWIVRFFMLVIVVAAHSVFNPFVNRS